MRNLLLYLTTYSFVLAVLSKIFRFPPMLTEYIRALVFTVFVAVVYIYAKYGIPAIRSFYKNLMSEPPSSLWILLMIDLSFHVFIMLWIGLPSTIWALTAAYVTFIVWYALVRSRIREIYIKEIPMPEYDFLAIAILPILLVLYGLFMIKK